jgi:hypothetical protein
LLFFAFAFAVCLRNMKYLLLLTVAIQIASNANGLPLPAGQIVKYRVPSKYFNQQNETAQESSSSLYNFLSQIHYGGSSPAATINTNEIQSEDVSHDEVPVRAVSTEIKTSGDPGVICANFNGSGGVKGGVNGCTVE